MVALNESFAPGKPALGSKNRVGNFFGRVAVRAGENRPATRNRIGEKRPTLTIIASGRPVWPNRDPIMEDGGLNIYGFGRNTPINVVDIDGRGLWFVPPLKWIGGAIGGYLLGKAIDHALGSDCDVEGERITVTQDAPCHRVCERCDGSEPDNVDNTWGNYPEARDQICRNGEWEAASGSAGEWGDQYLDECDADACSTLGSEWSETHLYGRWRGGGGG